MAVIAKSDSLPDRPADTVSSHGCARAELLAQRQVWLVCGTEGASEPATLGAVCFDADLQMHVIAGVAGDQNLSDAFCPEGVWRKEQRRGNGLESPLRSGYVNVKGRIFREGLCHG